MHHFKPTETLKELSEALDTIKDQVDEVFDPILVIQAENDNMIDPQSANYIYEHVDSDDKNIKWYSESGHVITIDKEKNKYLKIFINFRVIRLVRIKEILTLERRGIMNLKQSIEEIINQPEYEPMSVSDFQDALGLSSADSFRDLIKVLVELEQSGLIERTKQTDIKKHSSKGHSKLIKGTLSQNKKALHS